MTTKKMGGGTACLGAGADAIWESMGLEMVAQARLTVGDGERRRSRRHEGALRRDMVANMLTPSWSCQKTLAAFEVFFFLNMLPIRCRGRSCLRAGVGGCLVK